MHVNENNLSKKILLIGMTFMFFINSPRIFAGDPVFTQCNESPTLQFHPIAGKNSGYWTSTTWNGIPVRSDNMIIPEKIFNDGFTEKFESGFIMDYLSVRCFYNLKDNITGEKIGFTLKSEIPHS